MSTEKNNNTVRIKQEELDAKQEDVVDKLNNITYKTVKESKKEAELIGDSERSKDNIHL